VLLTSGLYIGTLSILHDILDLREIVLSAFFKKINIITLFSKTTIELKLVVTQLFLLKIED